MNNFKVAQIVAQAATDIDEANRDRSVTLVKIVEHLHCIAQLMAGARAGEIYAGDE